jgi:hypothetical protein
MHIINAQPDELITTRDFPVHSTKVLEQYFQIYKNGTGNTLPPVPLIHKNLFLPHFAKPESTLLKNFLTANPEATYFLLNGSHRTTAANLKRQLIRGMILETLKDIACARKIDINGEPYEHGLLDTIDDNIQEMVAHFKGTDTFRTVQQKTDKMVEEKVIPKYMIDWYRKI